MRSGQVIRRATAALGVTLAVASLTVACSHTPTVTITSAAASGPLTGVCPANIRFGGAWWPESTQGGVYQMLMPPAGQEGAPSWNIDTNHKAVTGTLWDQGKSTGLQLTILAGGPAVAGMKPAVRMQVDHSITMSQEATDDQITAWLTGARTVNVMAPAQVDPTILIWDADRHPEWHTIRDVGQTDKTVYTYDTALKQFLISNGILRAGQFNPSYDGSPALFMSDRDGAVGGFSTNELLIYRSLGVHVGYDYYTLLGYPNYRASYIVRKDALSDLSPCLKRLVPVMQRAWVDFMTNPDPALTLISELVTKYKASYEYPLKQGQDGVKVMKNDGIVTNGRGGVFGRISIGNCQTMLNDLQPIFAQKKKSYPADLTAENLCTNEFLDPTVRMAT